MKKWTLCKLQTQCLWGLENLIGELGEKREKMYSGTELPSHICRYLKAKLKPSLWIPGPSLSQMNELTRPIVYNSNCNEMGSDILEESVTPPATAPRRQRSSITSHLVESTSANAISSNPPSVSLPYGEATKCTWEEVRVTSWWSFVLCGNAQSTRDIYAHAEANGSTACVVASEGLCTHVHMLTDHPRKISKT